MNEYYNLFSYQILARAKTNRLFGYEPLNEYQKSATKNSLNIARKALLAFAFASAFATAACSSSPGCQEGHTIYDYNNNPLTCTCNPLDGCVYVHTNIKDAFTPNIPSSQPGKAGPCDTLWGALAFPWLVIGAAWAFRQMAKIRV